MFSIFDGVDRGGCGDTVGRSDGEVGNSGSSEDGALDNGKENLVTAVDQSGMSAAYERRAGVMASVLGLSVGMAQWLGREVRGRKV